MAFTRKFLSSLGLESDKVELIMDAHVEVTNALKDKINESEDTGEKLKNLEAELSKTKESLKTAEDKIKEYETDDYKSKYTSVSEEFEKFKADTAAKETAAKSKTALREYLTGKGYSDTAANLIVNRSDFYKKVEFDDKGKAKNFSDILKEIQAESDFSGFTPKTEEKIHVPENPPANNGGGYKSKKEIMEIKDPAERQAAIKEAIIGGSPEFKI